MDNKERKLDLEDSYGLMHARAERDEMRRGLEREVEDKRRIAAALFGHSGPFTTEGILQAIHELRDDLQVAHEVGEDLHQQNTKLVERIGYWERGSTARLLGATDDQLEAVRGVLRVVDHDVCIGQRISRSLVRAWDVWRTAGRPLTGEESEG